MSHRLPWRRPRYELALLPLVAVAALEPLEANLNQTYTRIANENYSAFGPVGIVALVAAGAMTPRACFAGRADARRLVLACTLPAFLILLALSSSWVPWLIRFFLIPAGLAGPLLAHLFRDRATTAAYAGVSALTIRPNANGESCKDVR